MVRAIGPLELLCREGSGAETLWRVLGESPDEERVRTAELIGALCLATDLGMGFPFEHGLHETLIAMRLAERLRVDRDTASQTYYTSLLSHAGCTAEAHVAAEVFGGSMTENFNPLMYGSVREVFIGLLRSLPDEDVTGARTRRPDRPAAAADGAGDAPGPDRLLRGRRDARRADRRSHRGPKPALLPDRPLGRPRPAGSRKARADPATDADRPRGHRRRPPAPPRGRRASRWASSASVPATPSTPRWRPAWSRAAPRSLRSTTARSAWDEVLAVEPSPPLMLEGDALDRGLAAMGRFADLISPYFAGHSTGVAELASEAAGRCRIDAAGVTAIRRAGLVHDLGRVAVHARVWQKPGPLSADELEQVRLHPYHTERCLSRSPFLAALAPVAAAHHERLDRSGYHRGSPGADLTMPARLLAAADVFRAMCEPRPHRPALGPERAAEALTAEANAGRLDPDAVTAVIEAAGQRAPRVERPAGLTEREAEVVAMLARGLQTRQVAHELGISVKTADRHVQNAYGKIGVSTRAAATLFAMEHGLVAWGELPIGRPPA